MMGDANDKAAAPHPLWCRPITIYMGEQSERLHALRVQYDGRDSGDLSYGEMLELVTAILAPVAPTPAMEWLHTPAQVAARKELARQSAERREREQAEAAKLATITHDRAALHEMQQRLADLLCWLGGRRSAGAEDPFNPAPLRELNQLLTEAAHPIITTEKELPF